MSYLTEDEAKTKLCPLIRQSEIKTTLCLASECMMWREHHPPTPPIGQPPIKRGYCGLAGDPYPPVMVTREAIRSPGTDYQWSGA